jgi:hypothetical protein
MLNFFLQDLTLMGRPMCQIYLLHIGRTWGIVVFAFLLNHCPPYPIWDAQFVFAHIIKNVNYHVLVVYIGINNWWMLGRWIFFKSKFQYALGIFYGNVISRKQKLEDYQKACKSKMIMHLNHIAFAC